jgi:tRNA (adenine-N(1)-)-methyltransferase non-catalytic subunit
LADRRSLFFAAGFEPAQKGNKSALAAAQRHIWPVLLAWTHFTEAGEIHDSAGWMSCAKSTDSKEVASVGWGLTPTVVRWYYRVWAAYVGSVVFGAAAMVLLLHCFDHFKSQVLKSSRFDDCNGNLEE